MKFTLNFIGLQRVVLDIQKRIKHSKAYDPVVGSFERLAADRQLLIANFRPAFCGRGGVDTAPKTRYQGLLSRQLQPPKNKQSDQKSLQILNTVS